MNKTFIYALIMVLGWEIISAQNLTDIQTGVRYILRTVYSIDGSGDDFGYEIGDTLKICGKTAYEVWTLNVKDKKRTTINTYLHIDGKKVFQLGPENTKYAGEWLKIYDFGLQKGEQMDGYVVRPPFGVLKFTYRCLGIKEDAAYAGIGRMEIAQIEPDFTGPLPNDSVDVVWLMEYGSERGPLMPYHGGIAGFYSPHLIEISKGREIIYSIEEKDTVQAIKNTSTRRPKTSKHSKRRSRRKR